MNNCWFCYNESGNEKYHLACAKKFFGTSDVPALHLDKTLLSDLAKKTVNQRIAVTGVQPKLSVTLEHVTGKNRLTIVGLWGEYILKPQHDHYPQMPETEDLTMHLAGLFKIPVCDHTLIQGSDETLVYLAKRFDRKINHKIHVEDFCQLSSFLTENKYKGSYEKAGKIVATYCYKGLDLLSFFELILFSYLSGNNDMHLKNFSLIHSSEGPVLSPAYDLLNVNLVNSADPEEMALTLNGRKNNITISDFRSLAKNLGILEKVTENIFKRFSNKNEEVMKMIDRSFLTAEMKKGYKDVWMKKQLIFS